MRDRGNGGKVRPPMCRKPEMRLVRSGGHALLGIQLPIVSGYNCEASALVTQPALAILPADSVHTPPKSRPKKGYQ